MVAGDLVFVSGQLGINPETGKLVYLNFEAEMKQTLQNVKALLEAANSDIW